MPDSLVRQYSRVADILINATRDAPRGRANPTRTPVGSCKRALRCRQIGIDVRDAVYVLRVEILGRARQVPGQLLVDCEITAPELRELEVGIGEGEVELRRRSALDRFGGRLVSIGIWIERVGRGVGGRDEPGQDAGIADLV